MHLSFNICSNDLESFIDHWSGKYQYSDEERYDNNIGKPLTEESRLQLFEWKNGSKISAKKLESINKNYPLIFKGNQKERYLNHKESGGAIWNIFYLHCLEPNTWPIYDQHTYRAMKYMKTGNIVEIGTTNKQKFESYTNQYLPFIKQLSLTNHRILDKALFAFGQFLKIAKNYA